MKKKLIPIALILISISTGGTTSPGSCQAQFNNSYSDCSTQYYLDLQVSDAFSSATGGLSFGSSLRKVATKNYNECIGRAISARDNCNSRNDIR